MNNGSLAALPLAATAAQAGLTYSPTSHDGGSWVELTILSRGNCYVQ